MPVFNRKAKAPPEKKQLPAGIMPLSINLTPKWQMDFDEHAAIREGYQGSTWVFACVRLRANSLASVPIILERRAGAEWVRVDKHPAIDLINKPSPDFDRSELIKLMSTQLDLMGNALLLKNRSGTNGTGRILELYPLLTQYAEPVAGKLRLVSEYRYKHPHAAQTTYLQQDVVHVMLTNPDNLLWGQPTLAAAANAVDIDNEAKAYQKVSFENRGTTDGVFSFKGEMDAAEQENIWQIIKAHYSGSKNSRAPLAISDATYIPTGQTAAEMDFIETRREVMREIAAAFGVPIEMLSGMGDANRASSETVRKTFWLDTMYPLMDEIATALNMQLLPDFDTSGNYRYRFDTSNVPALQDSLQSKLDAASKLYAMGVPFNAINQRLELGFEDIEGGDTGYISSGVIPANFDFDAEQQDPAAAGAEAYGPQD